jgi:hypothetical protein
VISKAVGLKWPKCRKERKGLGVMIGDFPKIGTKGNRPVVMLSKDITATVQRQVASVVSILVYAANTFSRLLDWKLL